MNTTLTASQLDRWNQTGYIKLPEFLSEAETQNLREWVEEISAWPADDEKWMH
ncbi:MAG TPA: phytanoyl-CoA dioxygenase family protein, partial [Gimesia maris]|nr:phytanoyl-CoA dioxygenase family protein [Gimesia maris]